MVGKRVKNAVLAILLIASLTGGLAAQTDRRTPPNVPIKFEKYYRTELYMGRSKPDGTLVAEQEWTDFLTETVTPRFPDGFTVLSGFGQFRDRSGRIVREPSSVMIFLYRSRSKKESRAKIEEIRTAYVIRFHQESVLRVDLPRAVRVSF